MLRADTDSEHEPTRPATRGQLVARTGRDAINETERRLCGSGAVSRPGVAEGLALQGRPAATLLAPDGAVAGGGDRAFARAAWVHHRVAPGSSSGFAFELTASLAQDGVDHCLVAHDLARRIGAAGLCTFDPARSARLDRLFLPDEAMLRELREATAGEMHAVAVGDEAVLAAAARAFRQVSLVTGRPVAAVDCEGADEAECALVVDGVARATARDLARALALDGIACRVVSVQLLRPFPGAELRQALAGIRRVLWTPGAGRLPEELAGRAVLLERLDSDATRRALGLASPVERKTPAGAEAIGLTARPAGGWGEGFLLDVAARLSTGGAMALDRGGRLLRLGGEAVEPILGLCAHPSYVEGRIVTELARGATLVIASAGPVSDAWWDGLKPRTRNAVLGRELSLHWLDLSGVPGLDLADPAAVRAVLIDGFLAVAGLGAEFDAPPSMRRLEPRALESARAIRRSDFLPIVRSLPRMPVEPTQGDDSDWKGEARRFHLTGDGAHSASEATLAEPLYPAVLGTLDAPARQGASYPWFVPLDEAGAESPALSCESRLAAMLDKLEAEGEAAPILTEHLPRLSRALVRTLSRLSKPTEPVALFALALEEFQAGFDLSDAARAALCAEAERVGDRFEALAMESRLVGLDETALLELYAASVRRARRGRRARLLAEIGTLALRLQELLTIDDGHAPERLSADVLESALGADAGNFFDPAKLTENLRAHRGPLRLGPARRERIERTLATFQAALDEDSDVDLILVRPESDSVTAPVPGVRVVTHPRGLEAAIGLFDGLAQRSVELFSALRVARLEIDAAYDAALHDAPLARLDWQGLSEDELLSLPRLAVFETGERLRGAGLGAFSELLRSGRPVHVLAAQTTSELRSAQAWHGLAGFHPGLGYVAVAHREAFVIESSLVCPERLAHNLAKMAASLRPAAALVAVPAWDAPVSPWVQLLAAEQARAFPSFVYDPDAGPDWADRFDLDGNPQPERPWPVHPVRHIDAQGSETSVDQPFTLAHAVALDPAYRAHFRIVPTEAWSAEQIELSDYLTAPGASVARKIPFIWVVIDDSRLARALVTRELAYACRDRARAWHILQELAGMDNAYARRAAEAARQEVLVEALEARQELEAAHAREVERVRSETVGEAMGRLARALIGLDTVPLPATPAAAPAVRPAAAEDEAVEQPLAAQKEDEVPFDDAYIDSALCTSCQECININPRLFKYDANKQAFIADRSRGSFAELVRAAEKCPARCIHPGAPSGADTTVTSDLLARAAKFN